MKLADMIDLESIATSVQVQVLSPAPLEMNVLIYKSALFSFLGLNAANINDL